MRSRAPSFWTIAFAITLLGTVGFGAQDGKFCSGTAETLHRACGSGVEDDYWTAVAICMNLSEKTERVACQLEARASRAENRKLCREQLAWRRDACELVGEDRYDPEFDPSSFETDFTNLQHPNAYFPLGIGYTWEYRGGNEVDKLEVLNETKLIDGVTCVVVHDQVSRDGAVAEDTNDWFAQATDENVWYCGEEVKDYESFNGDIPQKPELTSIDGSFKAGRNGDKPGIIFRASPVEGESYLEEFSLGNAEDVTEVLSTTYAFGSDPELDASVPQELAELLCQGDCVVTRNISLLEPGIEAFKYAAKGIGIFLEVEKDTGKTSQLVNCNFDTRCSMLPAVP